MDTDLIAHYTFDANDGRDDSGNGRVGTLVNGPTFGTGRLRNSAIFNGSNQSINL